MPTPTPNIWQLQSRGDTDALVEALRHSDAGVRRGAAAALRALGAWQTVPALEAALAVEHDWQAHAAITAAVKYLDRDVHIESMVKSQDVQGLSKMLHSPRIEDVLTACEALANIGNKQAVEPLVMVFRNPALSNKIRLAAAEALLKLESAPAVVTLLGALRRDDWQVRRNAAAVLGQLQAHWATEPLIKALEDENPVVRRTAAAALRRIGSAEAIQAAAAFEEAQRRLAVQQAQQAVQQPQPVAVPPISSPPSSHTAIPAVAKPPTGGPLPCSETRPMFAAVPRPASPAPTSDSKPAIKPVSPPSPAAKPEAQPAVTPTASDSQMRRPAQPLPPGRPGQTGALGPLPAPPGTKPVIPAIPKPPSGPPGSPDLKRATGTKALQELKQFQQDSAPVQSTVPPSPPVPPTTPVEAPAPISQIESKPEASAAAAEPEIAKPEIAKSEVIKPEEPPIPEGSTKPSALTSEAAPTPPSVAPVPAAPETPKVDSTENSTPSQTGS